MKKWNHHVLIHGFALLHAGTVALCAWLGIPDTLALTALTMLMAVFLCYEENLTVDISIMALILVNVLGFLLGNLGAQVLLNFAVGLEKHCFHGGSDGNDGLGAVLVRAHLLPCQCGQL